MFTLLFIYHYCIPVSDSFPTTNKDPYTTAANTTDCADLLPTTTDTTVSKGSLSYQQNGQKFVGLYATAKGAS